LRYQKLDFWSQCIPIDIGPVRLGFLLRACLLREKRK
jgi:hypothetical protein